jgi:hypothetical protein
MESTGRTLHSGTIIESKRSPTKGSKESKKKRTTKTGTQGDKQAKNADSQSLKASKLAAALKQVQEYLADNSEEGFVKELKGKRTRKKDGEGEMLSVADVAEANRRAMKAMETDAYALEAEEQLSMTTKDVNRYKLKSTSAKRHLKGRELTNKLAKIKNKLDSIYEKQSEIKGYIKNREGELLDTFLKEMVEEKHSNKCHKFSPEDSEGDKLAISNGEIVSEFLQIFAFFSIPSPSSGDCLHASDHTMWILQVQMHII